HTRSKRDWSSDVCSSDLEDIIKDRIEHTQLKSNAELAEEFSRNISYILQLESVQILSQALIDLEEESSMNGMFPLDLTLNSTTRSEERRVGKEGRSQVWT